MSFTDFLFSSYKTSYYYLKEIKLVILQALYVEEIRLYNIGCIVLITLLYMNSLSENFELSPPSCIFIS